MGAPSLYSPLSENGKSTYSISWRETRFALTTPPVAKIELYRVRNAGACAAGRRQRKETGTPSQVEQQAERQGREHGRRRYPGGIEHACGPVIAHIEEMK